MGPHAHGCDEFHWISDREDAHTLKNCPHAHEHDVASDKHEHGPDGEIIDLGLILPPWRERLDYLCGAKWVNRIGGKVRCDAMTRASNKRHRCKMMAQVRYVPLRSSGIARGNFCENHIPWMTNENENERIERWLKRNPPPWASAAPPPA